MLATCGIYFLTGCATSEQARSVKKSGAKWLKDLGDFEKGTAAGRNRSLRNPETVRSNRVVTFVTKSELAKLECIAEQNGISLSASIHLILTKFLNDAERCEQLSNVVK